LRRYTWLIVSLTAVLVAALLWSGFQLNRFLDDRAQANQRFVRGREAPASQAFDRIMSMDPEVNYPSSPEGVMDFFNETFYLIYSKSIADDGTLFEVMMRQRDVYSEELSILNPYEIQFAQLKRDLDSLAAEESILLNVERRGTVYDERFPNEAVVQTMIFYNTFGALYRNYFLIQDSDGRWRINAWQMTDENFTVVR